MKSRLLKKSICCVLGPAGILTYPLRTLRFRRSLRPCIWSFLSSLLLVFSLLNAGCSANAIIPVKLTYTYPPAEAMAYPTDAAFGAIAFVDERTFDLYLPYFNEKLRSKPARFVFTPVDASNVRWLGKPARGMHEADIEAHFILGPEEIKDKNGELLAKLDRGALVVTFPKETEYGDLSGQTIWLTPSVGWNEVFQIRGIYLKSPSKLPGSVGFQFSKQPEVSNTTKPGE